METTGIAIVLVISVFTLAMLVDIFEMCYKKITKKTNKPDEFEDTQFSNTMDIKGIQKQIRSHEASKGASRGND